MSTFSAVTAPVQRLLPASGEDLHFCREVLPRVSRTFAVNIRLLNGTLGGAVRTGYLLCRAADALEDSWPGEPAAICDRFGRFVDALDGDGQALASLSGEARALGSDRMDLKLVAELPRLLRVHGGLPDAHRIAVQEGVTTLANGMAR